MNPASGDEFVLRALRSGVKGYLLKTRPMAELVVAVGEVAKGNTYLSPGVSDRVVDAFLRATGPLVDPLTLRERQIVQLVAEGKTTKDIATILNISTNQHQHRRVAPARILCKSSMSTTPLPWFAMPFGKG